MIIRTTNFFKKHLFVISVLLISSVLRWILILRGGQFYFPDENRYGIAQDALVLLLDGKVKTALLTLLDELAHIGFKLTALIPALFENIFETTLVLPAIFFSFFSILSLYLIWKIALEADAPVRVANYALLIASCSQVLLYYSRYIFPYDQAMFIGLLALYVALKDNAKLSVSFLCGVLSFFCLVTYNGYWAIAAFAIVVNFFKGTKEKYWIAKRSTVLGLGFLTPFSMLLMFCLIIGKDFFSDYRVYLQKIVQGSFNEGWSLPFEYFWHAEHGFLVIVGLLAFVALFQFLIKQDKFLYVAFGGTLFVYLCLVIPSNFTHTFVVYGRTARQLMPFLVLTAAYGLSQVHSWKPVGSWLVNLVAAITIVQAAWNYQLAFKIVYPREFVQEIQERYPAFRISDKMMNFYAPLICKNNGFLAENFHIFYTRFQPLPSIPGEILMSAPHPENFLPHQYEGYTREERQAIREENTKMIFYKLDDDAQKNIENCYQPKKEK